MTLELLQDATVTLIAIAAATMLVRRVAGIVQPAKTGPAACASCASRCPPPPAATGEPVPVRLLRRSTRQHT